jgi:hypothetical protein
VQCVLRMNVPFVRSLAWPREKHLLPPSAIRISERSGTAWQQLIRKSVTKTTRRMLLQCARVTNNKYLARG